LTSLAFIPGYPPSPRRLLARFLPPLAEGVAAPYVAQYSRPGDVLLDPFGQSPRVVVEALYLGRRVVVANFNPISHLALSLAVRPPSTLELNSALTYLADLKVQEARLETYLRDLYRTTCPDCGARVSADAFEWETSDEPEAHPVLVEKTYVCPQCGGPKQHPADEADRALAQGFAQPRLDYHFLLERVAPPDDPNYVYAREALAVYPARTLAAIAAILRKLDAPHLPSEMRRLLAGLLVAAFDATCALGPDRPKALALPRRYTEYNLWLALEKAVDLLAGSVDAALPDRSRSLVELLSQAGESALYAHNGPAREVVAQIPTGTCALIVTAIPRPAPAYWTLSAVWSAWLWGRESAADLRSVLRRRRYDWAWHAEALERTLAVVRPTLAATGKMAGLISESEPGLVASLLTGADRAGYALEGAALCGDTAEAQCIWEPREAKLVGTDAARWEASVKETALASAQAVLRGRAESSRWASLHFGAWDGLARARLLAAAPDNALSVVGRLLDPLFRAPAHFRRWGAEASDDPATGVWYLPEDIAPPGVPLADRVEAEVLRLLSSGAPIEEVELLRAIYAAFPEVYTPGRGLALACLNSYAYRTEGDAWQLRPEDASAARAQELQSIQAELRALATRQGYTVAGANPQEWREEGRTIYLFAVITSAVVSGYFFNPQSLGARRSFLVMPGGRASLVEFKLRRDPRLRAAMLAGGWQVLKFRHVRRMASDAGLTRTTLEPALGADPLEEMKQLGLGVGD